jgi:hypothetical protein
MMTKKNNPPPLPNDKPTPLGILRYWAALRQNAGGDSEIKVHTIMVNRVLWDFIRNCPVPVYELIAEVHEDWFWFYDRVKANESIWPLPKNPDILTIANKHRVVLEWMVWRRKEGYCPDQNNDKSHSQILSG